MNALDNLVTAINLLKSIYQEMVEDKLNGIDYSMKDKADEFLEKLNIAKKDKKD